MTATTTALPSVPQPAEGSATNNLDEVLADLRATITELEQLIQRATHRGWGDTPKATPEQDRRRAASEVRQVQTFWSFRSARTQIRAMAAEIRSMWSWSW